MTMTHKNFFSKRVKEIYFGFDIIRTVKRVTNPASKNLKQRQERLIMKNEKKFFDGDKIYAMAVTFFAGVCSVGFLITAVIQKLF